VNRLHQFLRAITIGVLLLFAQGLLAPGAFARDDSASEAGLGAASVLLTIPYGAVKVAYAILGGITGGVAYVVTGGNLKAAQSVWDTSMRGTYIITPEHLRGEKPVRFLGAPPESEGARGLSPGQSTAAQPGAPLEEPTR
jgi:hypothetical protein